MPTRLYKKLLLALPFRSLELNALPVQSKIHAAWPRADNIRYNVNLVASFVLRFIMPSPNFCEVSSVLWFDKIDLLMHL